MKRLMVAAAFAAVVSAGSVSAAAVVDQDTLYTKADSSEWLASGFGRGTWISQSFTAGLTGSLDRLDLQIARISGDDLRVRFGSGQIFDGSFVQLYSVDIGNADVPGSHNSLFGLNLSGKGLGVTSGNIYTVILSSTLTGTGQRFTWAIGEVLADGPELTAPPYAGGIAYASLDQGATWQVRGVDRTFRTWVTAAVPEPASWALMIAGFGLIGAAARRRRISVA